MKSHNKDRRRLMFAFFLGLFLLTTAYPAAAGQAMPVFSLSSALDGKTVASGDFKGKILLVTFFTTWCPPCRQEIPSLIQLQNDFSGKGFSVIGMSLDDGSAVVAKLINKEKINYPVLMANGKTAGGFGGVVGVPTSFLVNREGEVIKHYPGYVPHSLLETDINSIL